MTDTPSAIPPVSARDAPRFASRARHRELGAAFADQGEDYDRLRPGYPSAVIDTIRRWAGPSARDAVDLGAGTGKLTLLLAARGLQVTAIDPSGSMLTALDAAGDPHVTSRVARAESTGLPDASADLVTAAQSWHWFDTAAVCREVTRVLRPDGVLVLVWNTLDVQIPWVHRYSRIMHAGDVLKDDFEPPVAEGLDLVDRVVVRWEDRRTATELVDLARTRSYVIAAEPARRETVLANLRWYVHEHLGHAPGDTVGIPYRTDAFCYRPGTRSRIDGSSAKPDDA
ncbi:class I SAM-dependent methyltransferase [Brachybacterium sp. AOP25-B2-12]|uniref:class I SAM-dependent methyltransferase n=1 Tax=Brachybacterium sp. AOP25-B2-12 TaxID=3457710 RepID=UPI00403497D8